MSGDARDTKRKASNDCGSGARFRITRNNIRIDSVAHHSYTSSRNVAKNTPSDSVAPTQKNTARSCLIRSKGAALSRIAGRTSQTQRHTRTWITAVCARPSETLTKNSRLRVTGSDKV